MAASLHAAITERLPGRLDFYEAWLVPAQLGRRPVSPSAIYATLSFLRQEAGAYRDVTERAGAFAADWVFTSYSRLRRAWWRLWPARARARRGVALARRLVKDVYASGRLEGTLHRGRGDLNLVDSLFCEPRHRAQQPLCSFYRAAIAALMTAMDVDAHVTIESCRGTGGVACRLRVIVVGTLEHVPEPARGEEVS